MTRLSVVVILLILVFAGCSSDAPEPDAGELKATLVVSGATPSTEVAGTETSGEEPTAVHQPSATVGPSSDEPISIEKTATVVDPIATERPEPVRERLDPAELTPSRCVFDSHLVGFGTAPAPTSTPVPSNGGSAVVIDEAVLEEFTSRALTIAGHLGRWSREFDEIWVDQLTVEEQAAAVRALELRLSLLCDAISELTAPSQAQLGIIESVRESVRASLAWVTRAIDELQCCGTAQTADIERGRAVTGSFMSEVVSAVKIAVGNRSNREIEMLFENVKLELKAPAGWLSSSGTSSIIVMAPVDSQESGLAGLGPHFWSKGAALKVNRYRNNETNVTADSLERFESIPSSRGAITSVQDGGLIGDVGRTWNVDAGDDWRHSVSISITPDFVYVIEYGCPGVGSAGCGMLEQVAATLNLARR